MALDAQVKRLNRAILKQTGGHLPGTINALIEQRDDWETPPELFRNYAKAYTFDLDPCANAANAMTARYFDREEDGLKRAWGGAVVWMHPPHSEAHLWARKAALESSRRSNPALVVALLPARTGDGWFHDYVLRYASHLRWLRGTPGFRLKRLPLSPDGGRRPLPVGGFVVALFDGKA